MSFRVRPDGTIETDSLEEAIALAARVEASRASPNTTPSPLPLAAPESTTPEISPSAQALIAEIKAEQAKEAAAPAPAPKPPQTVREKLQAAYHGRQIRNVDLVTRERIIAIVRGYDKPMAPALIHQMLGTSKPLSSISGYCSDLIELGLLARLPGRERNGIMMPEGEAGPILKKKPPVQEWPDFPRAQALELLREGSCPTAQLWELCGKPGTPSWFGTHMSNLARMGLVVNAAPGVFALPPAYTPVEKNPAPPAPAPVVELPPKVFTPAFPKPQSPHVTNAMLVARKAQGEHNRELVVEYLLTREAVGCEEVSSEEIWKAVGPKLKMLETHFYQRWLSRATVDGLIYRTRLGHYRASPPAKPLKPSAAPAPTPLAREEAVRQVAAMNVAAPQQAPKPRAHMTGILVGGPVTVYQDLREKICKRKDIDLAFHFEWQGSRPIACELPKADVCVILVDMAGNALIDSAAQRAKAQGIPVVRTRHKWASIDKDIEMQFKVPMLRKHLPTHAPNGGVNGVRK